MSHLCTISILILLAGIVQCFKPSYVKVSAPLRSSKLFSETIQAESLASQDLDSPIFLPSPDKPELIDLAKRFLLSRNGFGADPSLLSPSFKFVAPVVGGCAGKGGIRRACLGAKRQQHFQHINVMLDCC